MGSDNNVEEDVHVADLLAAGISGSRETAPLYHVRQIQSGASMPLATLPPKAAPPPKEEARRIPSEDSLRPSHGEPTNINDLVPLVSDEVGLEPSKVRIVIRAAVDAIADALAAGHDVVVSTVGCFRIELKPA